MALPMMSLATAVDAWTETLGARAVLVGYSGGMDSTVLLHLLAARPAIRAAGLRAIHVHHALQREADAWAVHCGVVCSALDVPLQVVRVDIRAKHHHGKEAAARAARHAAFAQALGQEEVLALAHHRNDQAETFLLRALRNSGPDGLAAMRPWRRYACGWLWRPLLNTCNTDLLAYARAQQLDWVEDQSNRDTALERNFLRHRVLPLLRQRWPQAEAAFAHAAALQAETVGLLEVGDQTALADAATADPQVLRIDPLRALPAERRARVLRRWIMELKLPPLPATGVVRIDTDLLDARADALPTYTWSGAVIRRWRDLLHAGMVAPTLPADWAAPWSLDGPLALPTGDELRLDATSAQEIPQPDIPPALALPCRVHARIGGERIVLPGRAHSHALKHVLQDLGSPPWERERLPLLSDAHGQLVAAGDLVYSHTFDAWLRARGAQLVWKRGGKWTKQG